MKTDGAKQAFWFNKDTRWELSGWVLEPSRLNYIVPVQLWIGDEMITQVQANRYKSHIERRFGGDGRHGLRIILPTRFYDGRTYAARFVRGDDREELAAFPLTTADLRLDGTAGGWHGVVLQAGEKGITGWALNAAAPSLTAELELFIDGEKVAAQPADVPMAALPYRGSDTNHAFEFGIPARFYDESDHAFAVRMAGSDVALPGAQATFNLSKRARPKWSAALASDGSGLVRGSVAVAPPVKTPMVLSFWNGEQRIGTARIRNDADFEADALAMAAAAGTVLSAGLRVVLESDAAVLPVAGADPLAAGLGISGLSLQDGRLDIGLTPTRGGLAGCRVSLLADGARAGSAETRFEDGRETTVSFSLPSRPQRLRLTLADGATAIGHGSFRMAGAAPAEPANPSPDQAAAAWVDPGNPVVRAVLSAWLDGLIPDGVPASYSGAWSIDRESGSIKGWAVAMADPRRPVALELLANGTPVARATAAQTQGIALAGRDFSLPIGFDFDLAAVAAGAAAPTALSVRITEAPAVAFGSAVAYASDRDWAGSVERAVWENFRLTVTGWVVDLARPGHPVAVALHAPQRVLASTVARHETTVALPGGQQVKAFAFTLEALRGPAEPLDELWVAPQGAAVTWRLPAPGAADPSETNFKLAARGAPPVAADDTIIGNIETPGLAGVRGWALDLTQPDSVPDLILHLDGVPLAHGRTVLRRGDIESLYGGHGYAGFNFEMQPNVGWVAPYAVDVVPAVGAAEIKAKSRTQDAALAYVLPAVGLPERIVAQPASTERHAASMIVLNKDGADILAELFRTALIHEGRDGLEWIVIDHGSDDASDAVCARARAQGLDVQFFQRDGNYSFSASNNFGVERARHDRIVFINNDIEFREPLLQDMLALLDRPDIGLVGVKLLDALPDRDDPRTPVQHLGVHFNPKHQANVVRPFEARLTGEIAHTADRCVEAPAATGALFAVRRADFDAVGGFGTQYFYGYEDVDLCMKLSQRLGRRIVNLNARAAVHHRGFTRSDGRPADPRRKMNADLFSRDWGIPLRRLIRHETLRRPGFWLAHRPVIGFAVTEASDDTSAGDFFTALELGRAIQRQVPAHVAFLGRDNWYDLSGVDILITMVDGYELPRITAARPHLQTVAWARNWFDRWCDQPWIQGYDQLWASSEKSAAYMAERLGRAVPVVRIATNPDAFAQGRPEPELQSDYCFTGSRFNISRDIEFELRPGEVRGRGAVFGHNWQGNASLMSLDRGPVSYSRIPSLYASTKIVLDDANIATKQWGSCNSRVFDALGAGRLVLTNGEEGAREVFGDLLPGWSDRGSLSETLNYWLDHPQERAERAAALRAIVLEHHTYDRRAAQVLDLLQQADHSLKFAIKIAAQQKNVLEWGDFHFANGLAAALRALGHRARVDLREHWYSGMGETDDVVIVLRGLVAYEPRAHQRNFLWIISHPDDVSAKEMAQYDRVFVASRPYTVLLRQITDQPIDVMLQCTDARRFNPDTEDFGAPETNALFVGNSRSVEREVVRWAIDGGVDLALYGAGWEKFAPSLVRGTYVPNEVLGVLYRKARWVLCDHWTDMKRLGFISNRVFDVLASGGSLIVDDVAGLETDLPGGYQIYRSREDLARLAQAEPAGPEERRRRAEWIIEHHSFAARAAVFLEAARQSTGLAAQAA